MADITPEYIRGFIAPFKLQSDHYWSAQSTLTQNGQYAGIPTAAGQPDLQLVTRGIQTQNIEVVTHRAGHVTDNAGFKWKNEGDAQYYGAEPPNKITDVQMLQAGSTVTSYTPRKSIRLTSGTVLIAYEFRNLSTTYSQVSRISTTGTNTIVNVDNQSNGSLLGNNRYPTICELSDASVLLAVWVIDPIKSLANVHMYRSTDDGQTFVLVSSRALPDDIDVDGTTGAGATGFDLQPLALAASIHQVLLFAGLYIHDTSPTYGTAITQYASANGGMTFHFVDQSSVSDASHFYLPQIVEHNGVFIIAYISSTDSVDFTRIANAFDSVFDVLGIIPADDISASLCAGSGNRLIGGDITMSKDTDGRLYFFAGKYHPTYAGVEILGAFSDLAGIGIEDYAAKWNNYNDEFAFINAHVFKYGVTGSGIINIQSCAGQGQQLLFCNWNNQGTNLYADSLLMVNLGVWSSQQYPRLQPYPKDNQWGYNSSDWVAADLPAQGGVWTRTVAGTPTDVLGGDHITLNAPSGDTIQYTQTFTDKTNGAMIHTRLSNVSSGTVTRGTAFGVQIQSQLSTDTYHVEVVLGSDRIYVYDMHAGYGTALASATGLSLPDGVQLLVYLDNKTGDVYVNYAPAGSPLQYITLTGTLTLDANTTQNVYWGIPTAAGLGITVQADYHFFSYGIGTANGIEWSPQDVNARQYAARGFYTTIKDGLELSTLDGAAREGDTYSIMPQYGSPVQRVLHIVSPSPQVGWLSDKVTDADVDLVPAQTIAFMMNITLQGTAVTHTQSDATGLHLTGINFKQFDIQIHNGTSWSSVATVHNTVNGAGGFSFTRIGAAVTSTNATGKYLHMNECAGWSILIDDGAGNVVQRRVESSGSGVLSNTTSKRAYLSLAGIKQTDPTSGTAYLIPSACTVILNQNEYAGVRIVIASQKTSQGRFQIGTMVLGSLVITSPQYGRGRTISFESNVIESEMPSGTLYTQKRGQGGRMVRVAWTDGVDTSSLFADPAAPDHYSLYSGVPIAARGDAPTTMMGLVQYVDGSADAIVYLPSLPKLPSTHITLNRYHDHILCTMGTDMQIEHVIGSEGLSDNTGEVFRVSTVVLREVR
tara:strand:- start:5777 stop:9073 length:3297 start_codon:yes stop_codon:yes gene_type:complete